MAVGALVGAGIGVAAGGIIGGAVSGWTAEGVLVGMGIDFGGGAIIGAVIGGSVGGISYNLNSTTALYRAVDINEYNSIRSTRQFSTKTGAMEGKQFGLKLSEVRTYAKLDFNKGSYSKIVKTRIPNSVFNKLSVKPIDTFVFKSGVVTVDLSQINILNEVLIYLKFFGI